MVCQMMRQKLVHRPLRCPPVTLQANLDNATDRDYWVGTGGNYLSAGLPRTLRVAATFAF